MIESKIVTPRQAIELVKTNDHIVTGLGCSEGRAFLAALHQRAGELRNVHINNCLPMTTLPYMNEEYKDSFFLDGWFYSPVMRKIHKHGNASFIPNNLHKAATHRLAAIHPNIYVGVCTPPDKHGYVSLSTGNTYERRMIDAADLVILEMNQQYPRTFGDVELHVSKVDWFIQADYDVPELPAIELTEKDQAIGRLIASQINDGDSIQIGIGGIPNAVLKALYDKRDLGVHTEMLTSELANLAKAGVITGDKKSLHRGKMVATFVMGDKNLYDFVDENPAVMIVDGHYVNKPSVIAMNDNQVSLNTSLEVDLTGQCASESIGPVQYSGTGGQADTARGAQAAKNGKSFIALYSTAKIRNRKTGEREEKSKIVAQLTPGAVVSLQRGDVDRIVTEYGIAELRGVTVDHRVKRLIAIAHPAYREQLLFDAKRYGIIGGF